MEKERRPGDWRSGIASGSIAGVAWNSDHESRIRRRRRYSAVSELLWLPLHIAKRAKRWAVAAKSFVLVIACKASVERRTAHANRFLLLTEGNTFERTLAAFRATVAGRDLLKRRPDLRALCRERVALQKCPPGSLGLLYAEFMTIHGLQEQVYFGVAIEEVKRFGHDAAREWFHIRIDATHDVRHVLTGYGPDVLGEICLLSFRFAQTRHAGFFAMLLLGLLNLMFTSRAAVIGPIVEAYLRGRRAKLLDLLPWENGLAQSLASHRAALGIAPPMRYPSPFAPDAYLRLEKITQESALSKPRL
jgi:ubiquinone biosynthesis protein COQ4